MNMSDCRRSILCVDEQADSCELLQELLPDYELVFSHNAFEAIRAINLRVFHAYILDYWLPDSPGPLLCREIRKSDPHGPVVFCTAAAREVERREALAAGASAYLCKPIQPPVLRGRLAALFSLAELESVRAKADAERAMREDVRRRALAAEYATVAARELLAAPVEQTARGTAYRAFIEAHGTRAHFERWWMGVVH